MGVIKLFSGNFAPKYYMLCNGQLLSIRNYTALFSILGTTYGGDGITTFALPNLNGRVPIGQGQSSTGSYYTLGEAAGNETTTLLTSNMPPHNHEAQLSVSSGNATESVPLVQSSIATPGTSQGRDFTSTLGFNTQSPDTPLNTQSVKTGIAGSGMPINNMQPYLVQNYIICVQGIFPSRP